MNLLRLFLRLASVARAGIAVAAIGAAEASPATPDQSQALVVYLKLSDADMGATGETFALYEVEDALEAAVSKVGTLDGHEIGGGYFTIYVYGRNARLMWDAAQSALRNPLIRRGSYVVLESAVGKGAKTRFELPLPQGK